LASKKGRARVRRSLINGKFKGSRRQSSSTSREAVFFSSLSFAALRPEETNVWRFAKWSIIQSVSPSAGTRPSHRLYIMYTYICVTRTESVRDISVNSDVQDPRVREGLQKRFHTLLSSNAAVSVELNDVKTKTIVIQRLFFANSPYLWTYGTACTILIEFPIDKIQKRKKFVSFRLLVFRS